MGGFHWNEFVNRCRESQYAVPRRRGPEREYAAVRGWKPDELSEFQLDSRYRWGCLRFISSECGDHTDEFDVSLRSFEFGRNESESAG